MRCATHPDVETNLRCGKCGKPICRKCLVQTLVGARCSDCARPIKVPTFSVSTPYYLRAIGAGLGMAFVCGAAWWAIDWIIPIFSFSILLAYGAGYAISEVISRVVNRKRGIILAIIAGIALVISYSITLIITLILGGGFPSGLFSILYHLLALALGIYVAVTRLR